MAEFFTFYISWRNAIKDLPDNVRLEVYEAAVEYVDKGTLPELSSFARIAFNFIKDDIDRQMQRSAEISNKRTNAVQQRWNKTKTQNAESEIVNTNDTNDTNVNFVIQKIQTDTNDTNFKNRIEKNRIENKNNSLSESLSFGGDATEREKDKFLWEDIFWELFKSNRKNPGQEAQRLQDFYSSQGWKKNGGQKITNLGALVRMWKCQTDGVRFEPNVAKFVVKAIELEPDLADRVSLALDLRDVRLTADCCLVVCGEKFEKYMESKIEEAKIQPLYSKYIGDKSLQYRIIKQEEK